VSTEIDGIYPAGEGSGYSGGIMSSALDGLGQARCVVERFTRPGAVSSLIQPGTSRPRR
jgi:uncharacterized FAD-dependent dehydrogenase